MRQLRDTLDMDGTFSVARMYLGRELVAQHQPQEGVEQFEYLRQASSMRNNMGDLGWAYAEAGRRDDALAEIAAFEAIAATQYVPNIAFARIHAGLRDDEKAIEWLNKAIAAREAVVPLIRNEPHFRHLHGDPRFAEILDRVGLPP